MGLGLVCGLPRLITTSGKLVSGLRNVTSLGERSLYLHGCFNSAVIVATGGVGSDVKSRTIDVKSKQLCCAATLTDPERCHVWFLHVNAL